MTILEMLAQMWHDLGPLGVGSLVATLIFAVLYCKVGGFFENL